MSQDRARTPDGYSRRLFLKHLKTVVDRLEFADELGLQQHRQHLGGNLVTLERLLLDLFAESTRAGRDGARFFSAAEKLWGQLEACVRAHDQGDLEPWRKVRGKVVEQLGALGPMLEPQSTPDGDGGGAPLQVRCESTAGCSHERGETHAKTQHGRTLPSKLNKNCRDILRFLQREGATRPEHRWTFQAIAEETGLSSGMIRRAMDSLRLQGLYTSGRGQAGGVWLTPLGAEVATQLQRP